MNIGHYLRNMLQLVFAPSRGWEDLEAEETGMDGEGARRRALGIFHRCFLPIAGVCAASRFVRLLYGDGGGVLGAVQGAIVAFVSLFLAAQFARWAMQIAMPQIMETRTEPGSGEAGRSLWNRARVLELICYSLTFLGFVELLDNVVKVHIALLAFLPIYVVFIIWKGGAYLKVPPHNVLMYVIIATTAIAGSAYFISFLLQAVI